MPRLPIQCVSDAFGGFAVAGRHMIALRFDWGCRGTDGQYFGSSGPLTLSGPWSLNVRWTTGEQVLRAGVLIQVVSSVAMLAGAHDATPACSPVAAGESDCAPAAIRIRKLLYGWFLATDEEGISRDEPVLDRCRSLS